MTVRQQDKSISTFRNRVRLALQADGGQSDFLRLSAITFDIAGHLTRKFDLPPEHAEHLHGALLCCIRHHFDGAGGDRVRVLGYSSGKELRKKLQCISAACKEALDYCRDLHDHLVFAEMQPTVMRLKSDAERLAQFESLHRQADAGRQRDLEAFQRVLTLVDSAVAQKPFPVLKKQGVEKNSAVWRVGLHIHNFWTKHVSPGTNDTPSLCKSSRYLLFATDVYRLLGYPAGERGMIKRLKEVARRADDTRGDSIPNIFGLDDLLDCARALVEADPDQLTDDELNWLRSLPAIVHMPRLTRPPVPERALRAKNERSQISQQH